MSDTDALVVFTPFGQARALPASARRCCRRRAASASTSIRCAAAARCAGAARCWSRRASSPSTACPRTRASLSPLSEPRQSFAQRRPLAAGRRLSCSARICGDLVIDVPASSQVHRQVVRKEADARADRRSIRSCACTTCRCSEPDMHDPSGRSARLLEALEARVGASRIRCAAIWRCCRRCRPRCARRVEGHGGGARAQADHRRVAGLARAASTGSRSTSARPPSPRTCAISRAARWSPPAAS